MIYQCLFFRDIGAILSEVCSFCVPEVAVLVASPEWEIKVRHKSWRLVSARVMTCFYIVAEFCTMYFRCIHNIFGWICMKYLICIIDSICITWLYQFYHVICEYIYIYIYICKILLYSWDHFGKVQLRLEGCPWLHPAHMSRDAAWAH